MPESNIQKIQKIYRLPPHKFDLLKNVSVVNRLHLLLELRKDLDQSCQLKLTELGPSTFEIVGQKFTEFTNFDPALEPPYYEATMEYWIRVNE